MDDLTPFKLYIARVQSEYRPVHSQPVSCLWNSEPLNTKLILNDQTGPWTNVGSVWYYSESPEVPHSTSNEMVKH